MLPIPPPPPPLANTSNTTNIVTRDITHAYVCFGYSVSFLSFALYLSTRRQCCAVRMDCVQRTHAHTRAHELRTVNMFKLGPNYHSARLQHHAIRVSHTFRSTACSAAARMRFIFIVSLAPCARDHSYPSHRVRPYVCRYSEFLQLAGIVSGVDSSQLRISPIRTPIVCSRWALRPHKRYY